MMELLPCLSEKGISVFAVTADQRFMLGEDSFLRTHYPITLRRFRDGRPIKPWTEEDLFNDLARQKGAVPGNRVYVLYGAAGSGKSELMRWLECRLKSSCERDGYYVRISRTELDPVRILQKILRQFRGINLESEVLHRWDDLRKKPVTLANHLVWSAFCRLLPDDTHIIPLSYKLRPIIEQNLKQNFAAIESSSELERCKLELISVEELEELASQCAFPVSIDYEQVRSMMVHELEQMILGGFHFVETIKSLSFEILRKVGCRPILLIDDLVQSMNLYASDLLDFFITMEEGCWDIVVGVTPASFEASKRGRELLKRMTYLDTFDDRLVKLWLTDEQGHESYFISTENCSDYARRYLKEFKRLGGNECGPGCDYYAGCRALQFGMAENADLAPFNPAVLQRIFSSLPRGKGKARYFIMALGEAIQRLMSGESPKFLAQQVRREVSADHKDEIIRLLAEVFAPVGARGEKIVVPGPAISLLRGEARPAPDVEVNISALGPAQGQEVGEIPDPSSEKNNFEIYSGPKEAIRDWLEGKKVNKELLRGLRLGAAHLCREISQPGNIARLHTARPNAVIKWDEAVDGSKLPVQLEGVDEYPGIPLVRSIGHAAFELHYLHLKKGQAKEAAFEKISLAGAAYKAAHVAYQLRKTWIGRLGQELARPADEVAYVLFLFLIQYASANEEVPAILAKHRLNCKSSCYPRGLEELLVTFNTEEINFITGVFKDWFLLRENVYDGFTLSLLEKKYLGRDLYEEILSLRPENVSNQYKVGGHPLRELLLGVQQKVKRSLQMLKGERVASYLGEISRLAIILQDIQNPGLYEALTAGLADLSRALGEEQDLRRLPSQRECGRLYRKLLHLAGTKIFYGPASLLQLPPIKLHQVLLALGEIEQDSSMRMLRAALSFGGIGLVSYANKIRDDLSRATKALLVKNAVGRALRRRAENLLADDVDCAAEGAEAVLETIGVIKKLIFVREYLAVIGRLSKYIEKGHLQKVIGFNTISKLCPDGQVPPGLQGNPKALAAECGRFLKSLRKLAQADILLSESLAEIEGEVRRCCLVLQKTDFDSEIQELVRAWRAYLQRVYRLNDLIGGGAESGRQLIRKIGRALRIFENFAAGATAEFPIEEIAEILKEILRDNIFNGLTYKEIMGELHLGRGAAKVMAGLIRGGDIALSGVTVSAIKEIKEKVPALASEIKLKLNL